MISIEEAQNIILEQSRSFGVEEISIQEAQGRVLAEGIYADRDYPPFNRSSMDGFAVQSHDLKDAPKQLQLIEQLMAGKEATQKVVSGTCIQIMTGAPVPPGADSVVKVEVTEVIGELIQFNTDEVKTGQNIAKQGEDATLGQKLVDKGVFCGPAEIGALAVTGMHRVKVYRLPEVAIISTGDEVVEVSQPIQPQQIRDSNRYVLQSFLKKYKVELNQKLLVKDERELLTEAISSVLDRDIIILTGGVSMGKADYVPEVLISLGVIKLFHKVKMKPGKPLWFGRTPGGGAVFGLPGNPLSCQVAFKLFIETYLRECFELPKLKPLKLALKEHKKKSTPLDELFPCKFDWMDNIGLKSIPFNGSGDVTATIGSDGLALHKGSIHDIKEGTLIEFYPW